MKNKSSILRQHILSIVSVIDDDGHTNLKINSYRKSA